MTSSSWLALAGAFLIAALPGAQVVRAGELASGGRLAARVARRDGRRVDSFSRPLVGTVGVVLVGAVAWRGGIALAIAATAVLGVGLRWGADVVAARRDAAHHRAVLTAVRVLAGELTAGARPADALAAAAATSEPADELLAAAAESQRAGGDAARVLATSPADGVRALAVAWRLGATTGAALAEVVDRVASDLAARDTRRRAVTVAVAGPRASAGLLAGLPAIGVALGAAMGARPLAFLLDDAVGRVLCCAGVILDAAGLLWIRRIVMRVQRA